MYFPHQNRFQIGRLSVRYHAVVQIREPLCLSGFVKNQRMYSFSCYVALPELQLKTGLAEK